MRISMQDIATRAGVHKSTVFCALKNQPNVSVATREKIQALAEEMGYTPDPALSRIAKNRWHAGNRRSGEKLYYLTNFASRWEAGETYEAAPGEWFSGAREEAAHLGYDLEEFRINEYKNHERAEQVLRNRGVTGVILAPCDGHERQLRFRWRDFTAVSIGVGATEASFPTVRPGSFSSIQMALEKTRSAGWQRPGLITAGGYHREIEDRFKGAFASGWKGFHKRSSFTHAVLEIRDKPWKSTDLFLKWLGDYKPDCLLSSTAGIYTEFLKHAKDAPWIGLQEVEKVAALAGTLTSRWDVGKYAVRLINQMLLEGERGIPKQRITIVVHPEWKAGTSFFPRK